MTISRRLFLVSCAAIPLAGAMRPGSLLAGSPRLVGEVWGLPFWASGGAPAPASARRRQGIPRRAPPGWHPEFS